MTLIQKNKTLAYKVAAILFLILVNTINVKNPILEQHSFRQTQTAISIFYLIKDGFTLSYITPVIGQPYSIPFEFPIFHFIVGLLSKFLTVNLDVMGRLVSLIFSIGVLIVNDLVLKEIQVDKRARLFAFLLIIFSPVFLFWSGTFMIESAALFFTVSSLLCAAKYFKQQRYLYLLCWLIFANLAMLQKVTTALFPYIFGCFAILYASVANKKIKAWRLLALSLLLAIPILLGYAWVLYTDVLKSANPIALVKLTSSALSSWNYGTFAQRLSLDFWYFNLYLRAIAPTALFGIGIVASFFCFIDSRISKRIKCLIGGFFVLYSLPQLVFTNLFIVHNYYHYAVIIYLCNYIAISYEQLFRVCKKLSIFLVSATCICSLIFFSREYRHPKFDHIPKSFRTLEISYEVRKYTNAEDVFVLFGYDWSSEVAYYSERKSLSVPEWYLERFDIDELNRYLDKSPKMIVFCNNNNHRYDSFMTRMHGYELVKELHDCSLFRQRT